MSTPISDAEAIAWLQRDLTNDELLALAERVLAAFDRAIAQEEMRDA